MRVFRTSGLPIDPTHIEPYKQALYDAHEVIREEMGEFDSLSEKDKAKYQQKLEDVEKALREQYPCTDEWDIDQFKSMQSIKKLVNQYGVVALGKDHDKKKPAIFIIDSKF